VGHGAIVRSTFEGCAGAKGNRLYALSATQTLFGGTKAPKALQFFHRDIAGDNNAFTVHPGQAYSEV
jgi:hypothetical protein